MAGLIYGRQRVTACRFQAQRALNKECRKLLKGYGDFAANSVPAGSSETSLEYSQCV